MREITQRYLKDSVLIFALVGALFVIPPEASAEVTCIVANSKLVNGKVVTTLSQKKRSSKCLSGEVPALAGPAGADGQLRVYGDGSAGPLVVSAYGELFKDYATDGNAQFSSINIKTGYTLRVPGGTILRASGNVTINGTLIVTQQGWGGRLLSQSSIFSVGQAPAYQPPAIGIANTAAGIGQIGTNSAVRNGGLGGRARILPDGFRSLSDELLRGGGGGAPGHIDTLPAFGGGSVMIIAGGTVTIGNTGTIEANAVSNYAFNGAGGGGGGIVVVAAKTAISHSGIIEAKGSAGNPAGVQAAAGGGGGGGLIILASPSLSLNGSNSVEGGSGTGNEPSGYISQSPRIGGGGGGASAGGGGNGANANANGSGTLSADGTDGKVFTMAVDPTALL